MASTVMNDARTFNCSTAIIVLSVLLSSLFVYCDENE